MKATDLRIGNYIQDFEDKPYYFQIESIENNNGDYWVTYRDGSISCIVDALEPIPLTQEWLVKFGFKEDSDLYFSKTIEPYCELYYNKKDKTICIGQPYEAGGTELKFLYVHQLQNLYFALTGEELTIQ
jgi:hypothetical protein